MAKDPHCPRCHSNNIRIVNYLGVHAVVCNACGFDETAELEELPESRSATKTRGPYRVGGARRTQKR